MKRLNRLVLALMLTIMCTLPSFAADEAANPAALVNLLTGTQSNAVELLDNKTIATNTTPQDDAIIKQRLQQIYAEIDGLKNLTVEVHNSVATIQGSVDSNVNALLALQFARQINGVAAINNKLIVDRSIQKRLQTTLTRIKSIGKDAVGNLPVLFLAMLVFAMSWWIGRWLSHRQKIYRKLSNNYFIASLIGQLIFVFFAFVGLMLALVILDATSLLSTILSAAGIFGLAISFAIRDTVENYIASVLLSVRNPFNMNDSVKIDNSEGTVARLTSRATILISPDGNVVRIPNSAVFKAVIINYTRNPQRRFSFDVLLDTKVDVLKAQALALQTLKQTTGVLEDPKPSVLVQNIGTDYLTLSLFGWVNQTESSLNKVRSEALKNIKLIMDAKGISADIMETQTAQSAPNLTKLSQPEIIADNAIEHAEVQDTTPDEQVKPKVLQEHNGSDENLLNPKAAKE